MLIFPCPQAPLRAGTASSLKSVSGTTFSSPAPWRFFCPELPVSRALRLSNDLVLIYSHPHPMRQAQGGELRLRTAGPLATWGGSPGSLALAPRLLPIELTAFVGSSINIYQKSKWSHQQRSEDCRNLRNCHQGTWKGNPYRSSDVVRVLLVNNSCPDNSCYHQGYLFNYVCFWDLCLGWLFAPTSVEFFLWSEKKLWLISFTFCTIWSKYFSSQLILPKLVE